MAVSVTTPSVTQTALECLDALRSVDMPGLDKLPLSGQISVANVCPPLICQHVRSSRAVPDSFVASDTNLTRSASRVAVASVAVVAFALVTTEFLPVEASTR